MATGPFSPLPLRLGGSAEEGISPAQHARLAADLVALKRVSPLAVWTYVTTSGPSTVTITSYYGQNGSGLAYAPTATGGTGVVAFAWASQYFEDEHGQQYPFKIRAAVASGVFAGVNPIHPSVHLVARGIEIYHEHGSVYTTGTVTVKVW